MFLRVSIVPFSQSVTDSIMASRGIEDNSFWLLPFLSILRACRSCCLVIMAQRPIFFNLKPNSL